MFNVNRRVSFVVALAGIIGWGIFLLLFLNSSRILLEAQTVQDTVPVLPSGVRMSIQTDKRVYRAGDTVLIAVRNDSRQPIWIQQRDVSCASEWWQVEKLGNEESDWAVVARAKRTCPTGAPVRFAAHTVKSDAWTAVIPGPQIGEVMIGAESGTYRITLPFLKGKTVTSDTWPETGVAYASSPQFTIQ